MPREEPTPQGSGDAEGSTSGSGSGEGYKPGGLISALNRVIGTGRKARLVSAGIAVALVVAIAAFIALGSDRETTIPQDGLTKAIDASCVHHKVEIAKAQAGAINGGGLAAVSTYADAVVRVTGDWRRELGRLKPPHDRAEPIETLSSALLEAQIEAGALARSARESDKAEVAVAAARVDAATASVEDAIQNLELERCGRLIFGTGRLIRE